MNLEDNGMVFLNKKLLFITLITLNSCSLFNINNFNDVKNIATKTFVTKKFTEEELDAIDRKELVILSINNEDEFLAFFNKKEKIWFTNQDSNFSFKGGKLIKTLGLDNDFEIINFKGIKQNHDAYIEFKNPKSGYLSIKFTYTNVKQGNVYLRTLGRNVNYDLIREDFNVNSIGWSGSNYYWLDKSENVLISKQQISPFGDKIRISK